MNTEEYIVKANKIHNNRFDYDKTVYVNMKEKIKITCKKHGDFYLNPSKHLHSKRGCKKCSHEELRKKFAFTFEEFKEKANSIHNNVYSYYGEYVNQKSKITITCKKHGDFQQSARDHLQGQGCPSCSRDYNGWSEDRYKDKETYLYLIKFSDALFKIGLTRETIKRRYPQDFHKIIDHKLWKFKDGAVARRIEKEVLIDTSKYRIKECDYLLDGGNTELRSIDLFEHIDKLITLYDTGNLSIYLHNTALGRIKPMKGEAAKKKVDKLDIKTLKVLDTYSSIKEAAEANNINNSHIGAVCSGKRKSTGGFKWQFSM